MKKRKPTIKQAVASIRRELVKQLNLEVPTEEVTIRWKAGRREVWIVVSTGQVFSSYEERVMFEGSV